MKHIFSLICVILVSGSIRAQSFYMDKISPNNTFAEVSYAGNILAGTINYERYLGHSDYITYYVSIAAGYWKIGEGNTSVENGVAVLKQNDGYLVPITVHGIMFNSESHLELGFGINLTYENILSEISIYPIVNLGYRFQPLQGGLLIRVNGYLSNAFFPGISIGYSF